MQMDSGQHHPLLLPEFPPRNLKQHAGPIDYNIISPHPPDWSVPIQICLLNGNNAVVMKFTRPVQIQDTKITHPYLPCTAITQS